MFRRAAAIAAAAGLLVSCGSAATEASRAAQSTATSGVASNETPATPSRSAAPTQAPTAAPLRQLTITAFGFGVSPASTIGWVGYGFTIRNENTVEAAESISVQISFADAGGAILATESATISYLSPGEHTGIGGTSFGSNTRSATKMTVQALPSRWTTVAAIQPFTFTNVNFIQDQFSSKVTGVIKSPFAKDYKFVQVSAIGVDGNGAIVGGGFAFVDFVPANGTAAVSVSYSGVKPANVVLYGKLTSLSLLSTP